MPTDNHKKILKNKTAYLTAITLLFSCTCVYAQQPGSVRATNFSGAKELTQVQKLARVYRNQALDLQSIGKVQEAVTLYSKAIELDPKFGEPFNDMGVILEAEGNTDKAQEYYLRAIQLDPNCLAAYANLAMLYETKRDLLAASFYWRKRVELGSDNDPWTQKAKKRLDDLIEVIPELKQVVIEQEAIKLSRQLAEAKRIQREEELKKMKEHMELAKKYHNSSDYSKALQEADKVLEIDPKYQEALVLKDMIKVKMREQEKAARINEMKATYENALRLYEQDNPHAAQVEIDRLKALATSPLE